MSLFDVIKYPVSGIFAFKEIEKLPYGVIVPWISDCFSILGSSRLITIECNVDTQPVIELLFNEMCTYSRQCSQPMVVFNALEQQFLINLKRNILVYEE